MSWAAHELENYFISKHSGTRASFLFIAAGAFAPDFLTKGFVYGQFGLEASNPALFHRGWPGAGFTHSLLFGLAVAAIILRVTRERGWALGFLLGHVAHCLNDINDSAGTMLFFPFSTVRVSTGMWRYGAVGGAEADAAAYYSSLAGVWDVMWVVLIVVFARRTLTRQWFHDVIVAGDPRPWAWMNRRLGLGERGLLAVYRAWMFYAVARIAGWSLYARLYTDQRIDLSWGGPADVVPADLPSPPFGAALVNVAIGAIATAATVVTCWHLVLRRWWRAGRDAPAVERVDFLSE